MKPLWPGAWIYVWMLVLHGASGATVPPGVDLMTDITSSTDASMLTETSTAAPSVLDSPTEPTVNVSINGTGNLADLISSNDTFIVGTTSGPGFDNSTFGTDVFVDNSNGTINMTEALANLSNVVRERIASATNASNQVLSNSSVVTEPTVTSVINSTSSALDTNTTVTPISMSTEALHTTISTLINTTTASSSVVSGTVTDPVATNTAVDPSGVVSGIVSDAAAVAMETVVVSETASAKTGAVLDSVPMIESAPVVTGVVKKTAQSAIAMETAPQPDIVVETVPVASGVPAPVSNVVVDAAPPASGVVTGTASREVVIETVPAATLGTGSRSLSRSPSLTQIAGVAGSGAGTSSLLAGTSRTRLQAASPVYSIGKIFMFYERN